MKKIKVRSISEIKECPFYTLTIDNKKTCLLKQIATKTALIPTQTLSIPTQTLSIPTETIPFTPKSIPVSAKVVGQCGPYITASALVNIPVSTTMLIVVEGGSLHREPTIYKVGRQALTLEVENSGISAEVRIYSKNQPPTGLQTINLEGFLSNSNGGAWGCYFLSGTDTSNPVRSKNFVNQTHATSLSIARSTNANDIVIDVLGLGNDPTSISFNCEQSAGFIKRGRDLASGYKIATDTTTNSCYIFSQRGASLASIAIKSAPLPTVTPLPTSTPTSSATAVPPTITPTTASGMYTMQTGSLVYLANFAHKTESCAWQGVAGQVFDKNNHTVNNLIIKVTGILNGTVINQVALTGMVSGTPYGPGGYEIVLGTNAVDSSNQLQIQLLDADSNALSNTVFFSTYGDCKQNLLIVNFKQQ